MWMVLLAACGTPDETTSGSLDETFALEWGSANRSEAVLVTERPGGGFYVGLEIAAPSRTDQRVISVDDDGTIAWELQLGGMQDDEFDVLAPLSDGTLAVGGRRLLQPSTDADSVAIVALVDPAGPEVLEERFYFWNGSEEDDRVAGITEVEDGTLVMVGEAGRQLLFAEVDVKGETLLQQQSGPEVVDVEGTVAQGGGDYVIYGTITDPLDYNDEGQMWAAAVNRGGNVAREAAVGELYQVRERGTDLVVLDDGAWLIAGETGPEAEADVRLAVVQGNADVRFDVVWDSSGADADPQLALGPDGTVWGAVVRNRDELIPLRIDPQTGDVERFTGVVGVDRVRDLYVDDRRFCVALALPGDVQGGYLASFACGVFEDGEIVWPELRAADAG